ncbi:MAG: DUF4263 domain-containing protein [Patescibacteria group bacterium]|nr:DUF4263 domain-containing protein [Patescibacteria group bacterium]
MISFEVKNNFLILIYNAESENNEWVFNKIKESGKVTLRQTFTFTEEDLHNINLKSVDENDYEKPIKFSLAKLADGYFKIEKRILLIDYFVFIYKDVKISLNFFMSTKNISIFKIINKLTSEDVYIGGNSPDAIPKKVFFELIENFPNNYEVAKYVNARISSILRDYFDSTIDSEKEYNQYMNKKISHRGKNLSILFVDNELNKYKIILDKLREMLKDEDKYNEKQWQEEIIQIILFIFPKYIRVFNEAPVRDTYNNKTRLIDYLLIDSNGNTDIIEIKKPFSHCIVTKTVYRDNYIPLRELSGTVMQIEKYIFYLNKWGKKGENKLTNKYKNELPNKFQIKITNPGGIIIMGREDKLSTAQKHDFEVIKRKYKNIIDIITYDDLLKRLQFIIDRLENLSKK